MCFGFLCQLPILREEVMTQNEIECLHDPVKL